MPDHRLYRNPGYRRTMEEIGSTRIASRFIAMPSAWIDPSIES
jgi:hypothetical protein